MADSPPNSVLEVHVNCRSSSQYLGTSEKNLYLLISEKNWVVNYFKGLIGVWFYMVLITTIGVVLSTYLADAIEVRHQYMHPDDEQRRWR